MAALDVLSPPPSSPPVGVGRRKNRDTLVLMEGVEVGREGEGRREEGEEGGREGES